MNVLVVGATGDTGQHVVQYLLSRGHEVKVVARSPQKFNASLLQHEKLTVIEASLLELSDAELTDIVHESQAVASCLGHTMSFRGIYAPPRRLVTDATRRLCEAIKRQESERPVKFVLMNTTGNQNRDLDETISWGEKCVIGLLRMILPPHVDNEQAADYLRTQVGQNDVDIEWSVVRPDTLINQEEVTLYDIHESPVRSAIFDAGKTSRINVGHFIGTLMEDQDLWDAWKGKMPVMYNRES